MKKIWILALLTALVALWTLGGMSWAAEQTAPNQAKQKEFRIVRGMSKQAQACIECHKMESPGIFADWAHSRHASANITCLDCHQAVDTDKDIAKDHFKQYERSDNKWGTSQYRATISAVVTPKDCSRCHPDEAKQYSQEQARQHHGDHLEDGPLAQLRPEQRL
jgi:hydroxylamine dehydrogenase